jgi:hypothetical protein
MRKLLVLIVTALCIVRARAATVTVPAKLRDAVPVIEVRVNGSRPLAFVLDTGSSRMLLDSSLIVPLGLTRGAADSIHGAGAGPVAVTSIDDEITLAVGSLQSSGYHFDATDLSHVGLRDHIDGILGYDFLERHVVLIDYARSQVTFDPASPPRGSREVPISIEGKWPFVRATVLQAGRAPLADKFLIDTGSGDAVDHPSIKGRKTPVGSGLGQPLPGRIGTADFELAGFRFANVTMVAGSGSELGKRLIGGGMLANFVVTIDYANARMYLLRR